MDEIQKQFKLAAHKYNHAIEHYLECYNLALLCLEKIRSNSNLRYFGKFSGSPGVDYLVVENAGVISRPIRKDLFVSDIAELEKEHKLLISRLQNNLTKPEDLAAANRVIYSLVMSFACCIDLWKRTSRKTPGTFFEIVMAGMFKLALPEAKFFKHINLESALGERHERDGPDEKIFLSTDLVIGAENANRAAVIPLKITTRERIVQAYAHQRILDSSYPDKYESFLACISETQLDTKTTSVNQICVPGTIKLYQRFLGELSALYYADIPQRYLAPDLARYVPVKLLPHIFEDVKNTIYAP
jgi:hypothetical protein